MRLFPKRRWLRFSVRTLLIAVTIFCVWLGWQVSIVREREALTKVVTDAGGHCVLRYVVNVELELSRIDRFFIRRWMGDREWKSIGFDVIPDPALLQKVERAFPEAAIIRYDPDGSPNIYRLRTTESPF